MVHTVVATLKFKNGDVKNEFMEILHSENGVAKTRKFQGCVSIECFEAEENTVVILQRWDSKEDHGKYLEMRKSEGLLDKVKENLEGPLDIVHLTNISV